MKNCPNCSAPYNISLNKCSYCGTSYFDLTSINFTDGTPIYLKLKLPQGIMTQRCVPRFNEVAIESNSTYEYNFYYEKTMNVNFRNSIKTSITFEGIPDENDNLFVLQI